MRGRCVAREGGREMDVRGAVCRVAGVRVGRRKKNIEGGVAGRRRVHTRATGGCVWLCTCQTPCCERPGGMLSFICVVIGLLADQIEGSAGWLVRAQVGLAAQVWAVAAQVELARNTTVRRGKGLPVCCCRMAVCFTTLAVAEWVFYKETGDTEYGLLQTTSSVCCRKGRSSVQVGA